MKSCGAGARQKAKHKMVRLRTRIGMRVLRLPGQGRSGRESTCKQRNNPPDRGAMTTGENPALSLRDKDGAPGLLDAEGLHGFDAGGAAGGDYAGEGGGEGEGDDADGHADGVPGFDAVELRGHEVTAD